MTNTRPAWTWRPPSPSPSPKELPNARPQSQQPTLEAPAVTHDPRRVVPLEPGTRYSDKRPKLPRPDAGHRRLLETFVEALARDALGPPQDVPPNHASHYGVRVWHTPTGEGIIGALHPLHHPDPFSSDLPRTVRARSYLGGLHKGAPRCMRHRDGGHPPWLQVPMKPYRPPDPGLLGDIVICLGRGKR